jgi:glycosyltransferase involved in cell wall biosynthesis
MEVSVIIPTYHRGKYAEECLEAILRQDFEQEYEVIVVDDGSTIQYEFPYNLITNKKIRYIRREHKGPSAARNYGIGIAKGKYVIFIGDDIICPSDFIKNHYTFLLQNRNCASAGATVWHPNTPNLDLLSLLQYIGLGNFSTDNPEDCGFYSFTTSNIAIPKFYLKMEQFDENFPYPALEDNELGLRLYMRGLKIKYNEKAAAYHKHAYTMEDLKRRQWELGYSIGYFIQKHPKMKKTYIKPKLYIPLFTLLRMKIFSFLKFYNKVAICAYEKYKGLKDFQKNVKTH